MTISDQPARNDTSNDDEKNFAEYLRRHPDFFQRHAYLLTGLVIPHPTSGQAVSLLERQVIALRDEQSAGQRKLRELIRNARDNDRLNRRMEELTLYLFSQRNLDELVENLPRKLKNLFDLEFVTLHVGPEQSALAPGASDGNAVCPPALTADEKQWLFGDDAGDVESCALLTLNRGKATEPFALLAIGSTERSRYHPETGTHYLGQLQRLLSASIGQLHARPSP
ncbi:MAG: DUF484 family protein [Proteobacteria bacterium]|nr:MAG: DUF484 family protein [Pseudomonadota bacterium]